MLCLHAGPQQARQNMDVLQPWMQECQALLRDFQIDPLPLSECLLPNNSPLLQAAQAREAPAGAAAVDHGAHKTCMVDRRSTGKRTCSGLWCCQRSEQLP
jgi:hypothetical protein